MPFYPNTTHLTGLRKGDEHFVIFLTILLPFNLTISSLPPLTSLHHLIHFSASLLWIISFSPSQFPQCSRRSALQPNQPIDPLPNPYASAVRTTLHLRLFSLRFLKIPIMSLPLLLPIHLQLLLRTPQPQTPICPVRSLLSSPTCPTNLPISSSPIIHRTISIRLLWSSQTLPQFRIPTRLHTAM